MVSNAGRLSEVGVERISKERCAGATCPRGSLRRALVSRAATLTLLLLMALPLEGCQSGLGPLGLKTAHGAASALEGLPTFAVINADWVPQEEKEAPEQLDNRGDISAEYLSWALRTRLVAVLAERGYRVAPVEQADFALAVDVGYSAVRTGVQMDGTRSFLGTGNRSKDATNEGRKLSVALDFVDLKHKSHAWRVTAGGPPLTTETIESFIDSTASYVAQAPLQNGPPRPAVAAGAESTP